MTDHYIDPLLPLLEQEHPEQREQREREHQERQEHDSVEASDRDREYERAWLAAMGEGRKTAESAAAAWHTFALKATALRNEMPGVPALPETEEFWESHVPYALPFAPGALGKTRERLEAMIRLAYAAAAVYTHQAAEFADLAGTATQEGEADR